MTNQTDDTHAQDNAQTLNDAQALHDASLDDVTGGAEVVRNAGLRSDGELVQAKKASPKLKFWDTLPPD